LAILALAITFKWYVLGCWYFMSVPCDKIFSWVPKFVTMWPWCLTYLSKTLILPITFEWYVLGLWNFTWMFLVTISFHGYQNFWPCDLNISVWLTYQKL
jgi:hypothetical protein